MKFDIEKVLQDIHDNKDKIKLAEENHQKQLDSTREKLTAIADCVIQAFEETLLTDDFRMGVLRANKDDECAGVMTLLKEAHRFVLGTGRKAIDQQLAHLSIEKKLLAEIMIEDVVGSAMYYLGAPSPSKSNWGSRVARLKGLDNHPDWGLLEGSGGSSLNYTKTYPGINPGTAKSFKENIVERAYEANTWAGGVSAKHLLEILCQARRVEYFSDPHARVVDLGFWTKDNSDKLEHYLNEVANNRRALEGEPNVNIKSVYKDLEPQRYASGIKPVMQGSARVRGTFKTGP